ncbi:hypothetical protein [Streptomyces sp. NPDC048419]|uniref:hypothetical protein n=1 Tax=Streptomyces sp. NPDC048419 TaxID=3365547 RepID=UPI0037111FDF
MVTSSPPRSPRLLVLSAVAFGLAGITLLQGSPGHQPPGSAPPPTPSATATAGTHASPALPVPTAGTPSSVRATPAGTPKAAASTPPARPSALPPHGEGVAGDHVIQRLLQAAWPADLPTADQRELLVAGRALLRADATGVGRATWPTVFPGPHRALAPAFTTARLRIQAAIARRDGEATKAVVHLVWAGTDRGGTFTDNRITDWYFARSMSKEGVSTWTALPRTSTTGRTGRRPAR